MNYRDGCYLVGVYIVSQIKLKAKPGDHMII
jgi:hypothetical protein